MAPPAGMTSPTCRPQFQVVEKTRRFSLRLSYRDGRFRSFSIFGYRARLARLVILFNKTGGRVALNVIFQLVRPGGRCLSVGMDPPDRHSAVFKNWPDQSQISCSSALILLDRTSSFFSAGRSRSSLSWWWCWCVQLNQDRFSRRRAGLQGRGLVGLVSRSGFPGSIGGMTCCVDSWCSISWRWTSSPTHPQPTPISPAAAR